ncbi:alkaline phosphatase family protein [Flavobacteriaceae bacterium]|nr:alkaline phosphatase family protein [Flavobacteriaceae bacterium]MDB4767966.1 alkaline phosphatase family protein [Flavobacteriaceae bacterium]
MKPRFNKQLFFCFSVLLSLTVKAQKNPVKSNEFERPKLVVGIVVDQMRYDYISRFWNGYSEGGFKRLVKEGFNFKNNHYNYAPTSTGPGHASVYTGTTPASHGIIGNDWYDKEIGASVYCAADNTYASVGTASSAGQMSPKQLLTTTISDQLKLHTQSRSKVIAIALKDRGAVLPGGHTADAAYWFHGKNEGSWISSTFYMESLPSWVTQFNSKVPQQYKKPWNLLKSEKAYIQSGLDKNNYEGAYKGETTAVFPHDLVSLWEANGAYDILKATAYGNSLTTDFALAALKGENLGKGLDTDFLAVSFSSTDYVGHQFGVNSREIEDTYYRLDLDLERLLKALDAQVGPGNYSLFLTADHAAVQVPSYLKDLKIPSGYFDSKVFKDKLNAYVVDRFGSDDLIENISNYQVFLNRGLATQLDIDLREMQEDLAQFILQDSAVERTYTAYQMWGEEYTKGIPYILQNGYNSKRSGDVLFVLKPAVISYSKTGSTHGSPQIYDTHTPLLFFGKGFKRGASYERSEIPDIAPTIAAMLGIAFPNGTTGKPLTQVLE